MRIVVTEDQARDWYRKNVTSITQVWNFKGRDWFQFEGFLADLKTGNMKYKGMYIKIKSPCE